MFLFLEERLSDSPFVERIWRAHSERGGAFLSIAASRFEMAVTRLRGRTFLTIRGPETKATTADCPAEGEWLGIRFKLGTFMPQLAPGLLRDRKDVTLPDATSRSFWLDGSAWEYPDFENAEAFVTRLVQKELIARDPVVDAVVRGEPEALSRRSTQRHFLRTTGLSYCRARQIERARYATNLLEAAASAFSTSCTKPAISIRHISRRSLKHFIGQTPAEIVRGRQQLSFLYKTTLLP